jgi:hypothetical protein
MKKFILAAFLLALATPLWAQDTDPKWAFASVTSGDYLLQEVADPDGTIITEHVVTVAEGLGISRSNWKVISFSVGGVALQDEGESLPRLAPYGAIHIGDYWKLGGVYDRQSADEKWRFITGVSFRF